MRYLPLLICCLFHLAVMGQDPNQKTPHPGIASYTFKLAYTDTYMFRGHVFENDDTAIAEAGVGIGQWYYNLWYAEPQNNTLGLLESEYNHSISYTTIQRGRITTIGYQAFKYRGAQSDTQEFFTSVRHQTKWQPTYGLHYDIDTYKGFYLDYAISQDFPLSRRSNLHFRLQGGLAYNLKEKRTKIVIDGTTFPGPIEEKGFFGTDGFTSAGLQAKYSWSPLDWFNFEVAAEYHYAFDKFLYENDPLLDRDVTLWRAGLTVRFP